MLITALLQRIEEYSKPFKVIKLKKDNKGDKKMSRGMKEKQILVIIKEVGQPARIEPLFDNTLEAFQSAVGGYIEPVKFSSDHIILVDEEGILKNKPINTYWCGYPLYGDLVVVGVKGEEFCSVKGSCVSLIMRELNK